jgi:hypothetical protein
MSMPDSIVQAQTDALLRRVAREQEMRCRRARDAAEEQARSIVTRAWQEARARLRQAAAEERRAVAKALADRRAALETAQRQREQAVLRALMDESWHGLPAALDAEWRSAEGRRDWCTATCALALKALNLGQAFTVEVDPATPGDAAEHVEETLRRAGVPQVAIKVVESLGAGLRIRSGRACVDATVPGLLASRERIESELLAELERLSEQPAEGRVK